MRTDEFAALVQQLGETPKRQQADLVLAIESGLTALSAAELEVLLATCENAMLEPSKTARTSPAMKLLLRASATRVDLSADRLLRAGISLPTLLDVAQRARLSDLPPGPQLADELVARLFSLTPADGTDVAQLLGGRPLLQAVQQLELSQALPEATAEALLRHAVEVEPGRFSRRHLSELGAAAPAWRPLILRALLQPAGRGDRYAVGLRDLVRLAQDWGLHDDPEFFEGLRQAIEVVRASRSEADLDGENDGGGAEEAAAPRLLGSGMPVMRCAPEERIVLVDGRRPGAEEAEAELAAACGAAARAAAAGGTVTVGLDAEWEDPRPLSLLQIAVAVGEAPPTAFVVDMLVPLSEAVRSSCQELLRGGGSAAPERRVLCFSGSEDARRLALAGLLPELLPGAADGEPADSGRRSGPADVLGWIDLQREPWGLGLQPSLQAVVKQELGLCLDKRHQRSNWDARPLSAEQIEYAALDACVLVKLYRYALARRAAKPQRRSGGEASPAAALLTRDEERAKWRGRRALAQKAAAVAVDGSPTVGVGKDGDQGRDANDGLRFLVPAALSKLMRKMRGLGLDTAILEEGAPPQRFAQLALKEERVILVRSRKMNLPSRAADLVYVVRSNTHDEQLREIIDVFDVEVDEDCLCGRCGECNTWDWRLATREEMRGNPQVSEKTLQAFDQYWVCGGCGKAFWEGRIHEKAMSHFRSFKPQERAPSSGLGSPGESGETGAREAP